MVQVPDVAPSERFPGRPAEGRVVVIAPTRAACETIEMAVELTGIETVMEREHGDEIRELARERKGFGIVAGTGTGKTLAIRLIAEETVGTPLRVGVVNREREATPETPTWNVVVVTTGIARRWLQDGLIGPEDLVVVDEIHQTSAELELCLALAKRVGCRFVWLSATVDPTFYAEYLGSETVIESSAFDPARAARVRVISAERPTDFLSDRFLRHVQREERGVAVFVPTRAGTEEVAREVEERWPKITATFYHGGEPISVLRPFLEGEAPKPYVLSMTAAGQSALNVQGLDTVVIEDARFASVVERGRRVLTRLPLGANEILQMAGRVHGRVEDGEVWILSGRDIRFHDLEPTPPDFQLAGDPERVALTCADLGVRADELDLPVPLDRIAYRRAVALLERRGLVRHGRLTPYGHEVEVLPVDRAWGEMLANAEPELVPPVAVCASIESLHRMLRQPNSIDEYVVQGSDHLTIYRIYEDALRSCGTLGTVHGLPRHVFDEEALAAWAEERGVLVRSIEDGALAVASIYRSLDLALPRTLPRMSREMEEGWRRLVARVMPFSLVMDEETSWGEEVTVSQSSTCGRWGAVAGELRYFSDRFGRTRGSIEGTQLPYELVWEFSEPGEPEVRYDPAHRRAPLRVRRTRDYHGFELDSEDRPLRDFGGELAEEARRVLASALAAGAAFHPDTPANRETVRELRELWRRSGGATPPADEAALREWFGERLEGMDSWAELQETPLRIDLDAWVPPEERERLLALPDTVHIDGDDFPLDYGVEDGEGTVRVRVHWKRLPFLDEEDVPDLGRPVRWTVVRGKRPAIRADTLEEARTLLAEDRRERKERGRRGRRDDGGEERERRPRRRGPRGGDGKRGPRGSSGGRRGGSKGGRGDSEGDRDRDRGHEEDRPRGGRRGGKRRSGPPRRGGGGRGGRGRR